MTANSPDPDSSIASSSAKTWAGPEISRSVTPGKATIAMRRVGVSLRGPDHRDLADFEGILSFKPFEARLYSSR